MKKEIVPLRNQKKMTSKENYMTLLDSQGCVLRPLTECAKPYYYGRTDKSLGAFHPPFISLKKKKK